MTGASHRLRAILDKLGPDLRHFHDEIQPKIQKLRELDSNWSKLSRTLTTTQRLSIEQYGYAPMTSDQIELAYRHGLKEGGVDEFLANLKQDKNDELLEQFIEELSHEELHGRRSKRQSRYLAPMAFTG